MEIWLYFTDPGGNLLILDCPQAIALLNPEHHPVSPVVAHINGEGGFMQTINPSKIKFPQPRVGLHQFGELDIFVKLD